MFLLVSLSFQLASEVVYLLGAAFVLLLGLGPTGLAVVQHVHDQDADPLADAHVFFQVFKSLEDLLESLGVLLKGSRLAVFGLLALGFVGFLDGFVEQNAYLLYEHGGSLHCIVLSCYHM